MNHFFMGMYIIRHYLLPNSTPQTLIISLEKYTDLTDAIYYQIAIWIALFPKSDIVPTKISLIHVISLV